MRDGNFEFIPIGDTVHIWYYKGVCEEDFDFSAIARLAKIHLFR